MNNRPLMIIPCLILIIILALPSAALEIEAPRVPAEAAPVMPENTDSFGSALLELIQGVILRVRPELREATAVSISLISAVMLVSILNTFFDNVKKVSVIVGTITIAVILLQNTRSMIGLASDTILQIGDYGKLLYPVMTAAIAAQGGVTAATALYAGTTAFDIILSSVITKLLMPLVYVFLALAVGNSAAGEELLKRLRDLVKNVVSWGLKTILTIFTTYMSITGVVSGTTDAATLKAAKVTISSVVPVVGGIMSDASEAVLVSAGMLKNSAGIYGILAILALFLEPFLKIGMQYLILKASAALCGIFGSKEMTGLMEDFGTAMGLLLAMTGSVCLLQLISLVCFMKGVVA